MHLLDESIIKNSGDLPLIGGRYGLFFDHFCNKYRNKLKNFFDQNFINNAIERSLPKHFVNRLICIKLLKKDVLDMVEKTSFEILKRDLSYFHEISDMEAKRYSNIIKNIYKESVMKTYNSIEEGMKSK